MLKQSLTKSERNGLPKQEKTGIIKESEKKQSILCGKDDLPQRMKPYKERGAKIEEADLCDSDLTGRGGTHC